MNPQYNITAKFSLPYLSGVFPLGLAAGLLVFTSIFCVAQGTTVIRFEGPPALEPGSSIGIQEYVEGGLRFRPLGAQNPGNQIGRVATAMVDMPDNGTSYLQAAGGESLAFSALDDALINLISVDLSGFSVEASNFSVVFIGYKPSQASVSVSFSGNGLSFRSFMFGPEFSGLTRVEVPSYGWSLDNLVVTIPEPGVGSLMLLGLGALVLNRRRVA